MYLFFEEVYNLGDKKIPCSECGHKISWGFVVYDSETGERLILGSDCLAKHRFHVLKASGRMHTPNRKSYLESLRKKVAAQIKKARILSSIRSLIHKESSFSRKAKLSTLSALIGKDQKLSPRDANFLLWRSEVHKIPVEKNAFKVDLSKEGLQELAKMDAYQVIRVFNFLPKKQQKKLEDILEC